MVKTLSAIRGTARQFLRDEYTGNTYEFKPDELDLHINKCLVEISQRRPYEVRETVVSDGTKEVDISLITNLLRADKAECPVGNDPPDYRDVSVFGDTLRINVATAPASGDSVYIYCEKVHQLTESLSTLSPDLERVLVEGVVAKAARAWCNKMRAQIVPSSARWYQAWANNQFIIYQNSLRDITRQRVWEFYPRD